MKKKIRLTALERRYAGKVMATGDGRVGHLRVRDARVLVQWEDAYGSEPVEPEALLAAGGTYEAAPRRVARFFGRLSAA